MDPVSRELYTVSNDTGADMVVFGYEANGEALPLRVLHAASRGSWGVSVDRIHDEVAISVEHLNKVVIYRRTAQGDEKPLRFIKGPSTGLADTHCVFLDGRKTTRSWWRTMIRGMKCQPGRVILMGSRETRTGVGSFFAPPGNLWILQFGFIRVRPTGMQPRCAPSREQRLSLVYP